MHSSSWNINTVLIISAVTIFTAVGAYIQLRKKKNRIPKEWVPIGKVSKLFIYPLKSGRRLEVNAAECTEFGFKLVAENSFPLRDRSFVVYGENNNEFKTARTYPKLVQIETLIHDKDHISFDAPDQRLLYVKIPKTEDAKHVQITLHENEKITTLDCGDEAASWVSRFILDKPSGLRLGYHDGLFKRDLLKVYPNMTKAYKNLDNDSAGLYSDLTSYLLLTQASLDELNSKLEEPVTVNNFRPNILVAGEQIKAFSEEDWDWIKIGNVVLRNVKPCTRCIFTTINPETAVRSRQRQPLKTLEQHNVLKDPAHIAAEGKSPVMGIYLGMRIPGTIQIDDVVYLGKSEN